MNEPRRWLDEGSDVSPEIRRLVRAGRAPRPMTRGELARSIEAIERIEARAMIPMRSPLGARSGVLAIAFALLLLSALAAAGIPALLGYLADSAPALEPTNSERERRRASPKTPAPPPPTEGPKQPESGAKVAGTPSALTLNPPMVRERPPAQPSQLAAAPLEDAARSEGTTSAARTEEERFEEEVRLLDQARAVRASDPASALALLGAHALRFPKGRLGLDRELLTIDALKSAGRAAEARARAITLLEQAKGKPNEEKLRRLVESLQ